MNRFLRRVGRALLGSPPAPPKDRPSPPEKRRAPRPARSRRHGAILPRGRADLPLVPAVASRADAPQDVVDLTACAVCGHQEWTAVCEFNRFLLLPSAPDEAARRAGYSLCHRCGVVFARHRPIGARFRYLLERFEETLGREDGGSALGSHRLTDDAAAAIRVRLAAGVFVSEYPRQKGRTHLPGLFRDRMAVAPHVELIGSLVALTSPRVLEVRPRFGALGASLRRLYGGETAALPLFETQQLLVREAYGTRADALLDYDQFQIPYEGVFDVVAANHLLTHAVRPAEALAVIRSKLAPGGHLYLYNEPDEADFLESRKSIFNTLNAFHLQTFDGASLGRALAAAGFEPIFIGHHLGNCVALARAAGAVEWEPMRQRERDRRLAKYAASRDRGILALPAELRGLFADEWEAILARGVAAQLVEYDGDGRPRLVKS
jgi:SAM-dependent methyltransferase